MGFFTDLDSKVGSVIGQANSSVSNFIDNGKKALDSFLGKQGEGYNLNSRIGANSIENKISEKLAFARSSNTPNMIVYPMDLYDPNRGNKTASIVFHILINTESKFAAANPDKKTDKDSIVANKNTLMEGPAGGAQAIADVAASIAGSIGQAAASVVKGIGVVSGSTTVQASGDNINNGRINLEKDIKQIGEAMSRSMKQLKTSIALPMPNQLQASYGMDYSMDENGILSSLILDKGDPAEKFKALGNLDSKTVTKALVAKFGSPTMAQKAGVAMNPRKEVTFQDVQKRKFQYQFEFAPQSPEEYSNILEIIDTFKIHMHPELFDQFKLMYRTPDEFDIEYHFAGTQNKALHRVSTCYLTDLQVDYAQQGWSNHEGGYPTQINLSLSFQEIETLTRERIMEWENGRTAGGSTSAAPVVTQQVNAAGAINPRLRN